MDILLQAIEQRRSRRKYLPTPLAPLVVMELNKRIGAFNENEGLKMHLILDNGSAFDGLRKSYGLFSGVLHYIAQVGDKTDMLEIEKLGYYGELLVLHATALGLGTCWVGGTYDESSCPVTLEEHKSILCTIVVGNTAPDLSAKEKLIRWGTHRKAKTTAQMYTCDKPVPGWFLAGMEAVQKAPSAINRQPVQFAYKDNTVSASVADMTDRGSVIDMGIAKLHFEIGAGGGNWAFGNGAVFNRQTVLD